MRMQSPASSGLLPASYSRRRRNRPNESLVEGGAAGNGGGPSHYGRGNSNPSTRARPLYALTSYDARKLSDGSENDGRWSNAASRTDAYEEGYEDVLDKPPKLSDFLINDRCYQRYLLEGKRTSYRGIEGKNATIRDTGGGIMDPSFLARVSAGASFVGMLFLIFVAILMETQPLFLKGVSMKPATGDDGTYRFRMETSNALKAAAAYFLAMVCSLVYLQAKDMHLELSPALGRICHLRRLAASAYFRRRRRHYDCIPDGSYGGGDAGGAMLPMHVNAEDKAMKGRRRRKRRSRRKGVGDGGGGTIEGVIGKIKSWGIGGGSSRTGRKKDR